MREKLRVSTRPTNASQMSRASKSGGWESSAVFTTSGVNAILVCRLGRYAPIIPSLRTFFFRGKTSVGGRRKKFTETTATYHL